jgi:hypothetical protein
MAKTNQKPKRKSKGKQHPVHAQSLIEMADKLEAHLKNPQVDTRDIHVVSRILIDVLRDEGKRVQGILR